MKKSLFKTSIILSVIIGILTPAIAELTIEDSTDPQLLIYGGYSVVMTEAVQRTKDRANRVPYVSTKEQKEYPIIIRWIRSTFEYLDPALGGDTFMNHDIKTTPQVDDL